MYNLIDCPPTLGEMLETVHSDIIPNIVKQNEMIASDMYNTWVGEASEEAQASSNEDAYAYLFKMRRDELLDILAAREVYTWRKRSIAKNILYLMGYNVHIAGNPILEEDENV